MLGLLRAKAGHPGINLRYVIGPSKTVTSRTVPLVTIYLCKDFRIMRETKLNI